MALEGKLKGLDGTVCSDCGAVLELRVCRSAAGYYLGYFCDQCGPYSRETGYYPTREEAEEELAKEVPDKLRTTEFKPAPFEFLSVTTLPLERGSFSGYARRNRPR